MCAENLGEASNALRQVPWEVARRPTGSAIAATLRRARIARSFIYEEQPKGGLST